MRREEKERKRDACAVNADNYAGMSARYSSWHSAISVSRAASVKNAERYDSSPCSQERRRINKEVESFRRVHQRAEDRRDYDLYDPEGLKKSLPARVDDNGDDPRLGAASAQKCVNSPINTANNAWCNREERFISDFPEEDRRACALAKRQLSPSSLFRFS